MNMSDYLQEDEIINFSHPKVLELASQLAKETWDDIAIAKACFIFVRDHIEHTGDYKNPQPTCLASEVLEYKTGWCYAKSHLLAALLRANDIPAGFCYQRLFCDEYTKETYCLHGFNAIYLKKFGWYKVDARGNKQGVNAQFDPPYEKLAFDLLEGESELPSIYNKPLETVITSLGQDYETMITNFPDIVCN